MGGNLLFPDRSKDHGENGERESLGRELDPCRDAKIGDLVDAISSAPANG